MVIPDENLLKIYLKFVDVNTLLSFEKRFPGVKLIFPNISVSLLDCALAHYCTGQLHHQKRTFCASRTLFACRAHFLRVAVKLYFQRFHFPSQFSFPWSVLIFLVSCPFPWHFQCYHIIQGQNLYIFIKKSILIPLDILQLFRCTKRCQQYAVGHKGRAAGVPGTELLFFTLY